MTPTPPDTGSATSHTQLEVATTPALSLNNLRERFAEQGYMATNAITMAVYLGQALQKPILVEGPPGVGKTELAKASASLLGVPLIRLQCYEGLDESKALYEWKYGKQLLYTQILKDKLGDLMKGTHTLAESVTRLHEFGDIFYSEDFLEPRPLLKALREENGCVLLIDEIDKADHEFESFLLELLSDYQITVPEIGTVRANSIPLVFLTSNNTRELSDALKRRCLHLYIPFPDIALENAIVRSRVPKLHEDLRQQLVDFVHKVRELDLRKQPAISETIDWAKALVMLHADKFESSWIADTLNLLLKHEDDINQVKGELNRLLAPAKK